jgi:hypothetical protein
MLPLDSVTRQPGSKAMYRYRHTTILNIVVVVVSVALTLVVLEVVLRAANKQKYFAVTVNTWDPVTGTKHIRGAKGFVRCPEYDIDVIINSKGLRDREFAYAKPEGTLRILCLGGSFTCGYGVQAEETFAKVLETLLNQGRDSSQSWQVLNAGVGSTGTAHQLAYFESEGHKYHPDFVLVCFSQGTDFWDNIVSGLYSIEDGRLVKHEAPKTGGRRIQEITRWIPGYNTFFARSHLLNFIKGRISRHHYRDLAERLVLPENESAVEQQEEELTRHLLLGLLDACEAQDCRLVVTGIPLAHTWGWKDEARDIITFLGEKRIPFVDLSDSLKKGSERGIRISYERDRHWTPAGHRLAAEALYEYFRATPGARVSAGHPPGL